MRKPRGRPAEVPIGAQDAVAREWVVVCDAPELSACLVGWERPPVPGGERCFETFWTVEPNVVRDAARIFRGLIAVRAPKLLEGLGDRLDEDPPRADSAALRAAVAVASRVVVSADRGE